MLQSNNILVSGCGFSWSGQEHKTWVNAFKAAGCKITDVGGPAVSNQWILNKTITELFNNEYESVIVQLTSLGKLDVEVDEIRKAELVDTDSLRNFTVNGIWPSSHSTEHISKQFYQKYLVSPTLELEDVYCKLILLSEYCKQYDTKLIILQAYEMPWSEAHKERLQQIILNFERPLYTVYVESDYYKNHDKTNSNSVPCVDYQVTLAINLAEMVNPGILVRLEKIKKHLVM